MKSQATRSRSQNRKHARLLLAEKLEEMEKGPESRRAVKGEVKRKKKASASKKAKRKYRLLGDAKRDGLVVTGAVDDAEGAEEIDGDEEEEDDDDDGEGGNDVGGGQGSIGTEHGK